MPFDLLLVGAGHAHLGVLRRWTRGKRPAGRIALLSEGPWAWYSGMLPGLLGGRYRPEQCRVELAPLCRAAGVALVIDQVAALDAAALRLGLSAGTALEAAWLSLNVGARVLAPPSQDLGLQLLTVKPFDAFVAAWPAWQADPQPLAIVGGGAAGVELALALAGRVPALALFAGGPLLAGLAPGLRLRALSQLRQRGVQVREDCPIQRVVEDQLQSGGETVWRGPRLLLASGASPWPWLHESGLACDDAGFLTIAATLQCQSHPRVFAVGDCASLPGAVRNGVYAVRQGPVLADNLAAALSGQALRRYRPQPRSLALLASGDGGALMAWGRWSGGGRLYGWWKERLDLAFIQAHQGPNGA
ncbi:MAG: FAD-dependent oxidoreductase [Pseudomonas sp.]|uniref:FAD-dependent oxidoreductase n=1 Tax=Pseudomonas sp. TaxID=306 RepID=UPI003396A0D1